MTTGLTAALATIWAAPPGETLCEDYALRVNGQPVPVYSCRVSAVPFNQVWPGCQRPIHQTEFAGFAHWGMAGPVSVEITSKRPFTNVVVRPSARQVRPSVNGRIIAFAFPKVGQVTVELDGPHHALHLFADPPETDMPTGDGAGLRYFGPGVHRPGKIRLKSGETLYVAGGAVVYTAVEARGGSGVRILGRGIIDASDYERDQGGEITSPSTTHRGRESGSAFDTSTSMTWPAPAGAFSLAWCTVGSPLGLGEAAGCCRVAMSTARVQVGTRSAIGTISRMKPGRNA
ncbi:MAG: hypothetical protein ACYDH9_11805 [Limisphaerales bacterium]